MPGKNIVFPDSPERIRLRDFDLAKARTSYIRNSVTQAKRESISKEDLAFLAAETKSDENFVLGVLKELNVSVK